MRTVNHFSERLWNPGDIFSLCQWNEEMVLELQIRIAPQIKLVGLQNLFGPVWNSGDISKTFPSFDQSFSYSSHEWENSFRIRRLHRDIYIFDPGFILNYSPFSLFICGSVKLEDKHWLFEPSFKFWRYHRPSFFAAQFLSGMRK